MTELVKVIGRARSRAAIALIFGLVLAPSAQAQRGHRPREGERDRDRRGQERYRSSECEVICAPTLTLMPGMIRTHVFGQPLVQSTTTAVESRLPQTSAFVAIVSLTARTGMPRVGLYGNAVWLPNVSEARNPFTLYAASAGTTERANAPVLAGGLSVALLRTAETNGWFDLGVKVGDLYSQAARPDDRSEYTNKLDLGLVTHLYIFSTTPSDDYLHRVSVYAMLDYVGSGLPRAGDVVPAGRRFVTDARPASLLVGLSLPIAGRGY